MLKLKKKKKHAGGLAKFMKFNKPTLTDSGGFQAFSLGWGRVHNSSKIGFIPNKNNIKKSLSSPHLKRCSLCGTFGCSRTPHSKECGFNVRDIKKNESQDKNDR